MRQISSAEAFRELTNWSKDSLVGCAFSSQDQKAALRLRHAKSELRESSLILDGKHVIARFDFCDDVAFALGDANDLAAAYSKGLDIPSDTCIRATFADGDLCLIFPER
jgi:hypothetical protein